MNIRQAILAAADHIERNPGEFNFNSFAVPDQPGCGTPGCAIGWVACFMGEAFPRRDLSWAYEYNPLGVKDHDFYRRMTAFEDGWFLNASRCARALRLYADKYHPATERPLVYPNWNAIATALSAPVSDAQGEQR